MKRICCGTATLAVFAVLTALVTAYSIHHRAGEPETPNRSTGQAGWSGPQSSPTAAERPGVPTMAPPRSCPGNGVSQSQQKHSTQIVYVTVETDRPDIEVQLHDLIPRMPE